MSSASSGSLDLSSQQPSDTDIVFIPKGAVYYVQPNITDHELNAISACVDIVSRYCPDERARERVMRYLWERFST